MFILILLSTLTICYSSIYSKVYSYSIKRIIITKNIMILFNIFIIIAILMAVFIIDAFQYILTAIGSILGMIGIMVCSS